jgi:cytochrome c
MTAFEWNKIVAASLVALIIAVISGLLAKGLVNPVALTKEAYPIGTQVAAAPAASAAEDEPAPLTSDQLAKADAAKGATIAKKCEACHSLGKGEAAKIGPNLWGVINDKRAHMAGFEYSDAMTKLGGTWTVQNIAAFIYKPQAYLPGTKMGFPGLPDAQDRADVIAYLNSQSAAKVDLAKEGASPAK